jgi:LytR cell envelope-related transcriptional attenuator
LAGWRAVDDPSQPEEAAARGRRGRPGGFPTLRALALLAVFVVVAIVSLGKVHGTTTPSVASPTTTAPPKTVAHSGSTHASSTTTTSTTHPPGSVPVLVANATAVSGAAGDVSNELQAVGWSMLPPVNASTRVSSSHVYYVAGREQEAASVAATLHLPSSAVMPYTTAAPISSIGTAEVVVVVGPDLAATATTTSTT